MAEQLDVWKRQPVDPPGYRWSEYECRYLPTLGPDGAMVDSAGDARTVNNLMRHQYRVLSEDEKQAMVRIKDLGLDFVRELHLVGGSLHHFEVDGDRAKQQWRELAIAQTKIEEAVMWAVKHLTR